MFIIPRPAEGKKSFHHGPKHQGCISPPGPRTVPVRSTQKLGYRRLLPRPASEARGEGGGENSPNEQFALGPPELGWPQHRAVRLACPFSGCPFSGLPYPGQRRRDALPYIEVHGEAQQGYGEQGLLPDLAASSPRPSPPEEERETDSPADGSFRLRTAPGTGGGRVPCTSLVHPLCIWTFNVNAVVATAC